MLFSVRRLLITASSLFNDRPWAHPRNKHRTCSSSVPMELTRLSSCQSSTGNSSSLTCSIMVTSTTATRMKGRKSLASNEYLSSFEFHHDRLDLHRAENLLKLANKNDGRRRRSTAYWADQRLSQHATSFSRGKLVIKIGTLALN